MITDKISIDVEGDLSAEGANIGPILNAEKIRIVLKTLPKLKNCNKISFKNNKIRKIELTRTEINELEIERIRSLDLSKNLLYEIDAKNILFSYLEELYLQENKIKRIMSLGFIFSNILILNLSNNQLESLAAFRGTQICSTLRELYLANNQFKDVSSLAELVLMEKLVILDVSNNPVGNNLIVEGFCILSCALLKEFNTNEVSQQIRSSVLRWSCEHPHGKQVSTCIEEYRKMLLTLRGPCDFCAFANLKLSDVKAIQNSHQHSHSFQFIPN